MLELDLRINVIAIAICAKVENMAKLSSYTENKTYPASFVNLTISFPLPVDVPHS